MMRLLGGNEHLVHTAVCVSFRGKMHCFTATTAVLLFPMGNGELEEYISTDEPYDKAGAYGIQGTMSRYLDRLSGDYFNVLGLPVSRLWRLLRGDRRALNNCQGW